LLDDPSRVHGSASTMDDRKSEWRDCEAQLMLIRVQSVFEQNLYGFNGVPIDCVVESGAAVEFEVIRELSFIVLMLR
jgi:hypothetical protein